MTEIPGRDRWRRILARLGIALVAACLALVVGLAALLAVLWMKEEKPRFDEAEAARVEYSPLEQVVPGRAAPPGVEPMGSVNNLDVARFEGRFFLAYRTAPTHFASARARLFVVSSTDRQQWAKEAEFGLEDDLREPRFLVFNNKLFLYFFRAGANPFAFEPRSIYAAERAATGQWTAPKPIFKPGFVIWRAKAFQDTAYMSVYYGAGLYTTAERAGEVRLLTSKDGYDWEPISEAPQVDQIGAEEGEFEFDAAGNLVATVRLEVKGGLVCTAPKADLAHWKCTYTPYKYDSALMLRHGADFYVIARRNVAGPFEKPATVLPPSLHRGCRLAAYSLTRKRTALYKVDVEQQALVPLFDFPSRGDTAYAGAVPLDENAYYVVNYSSAIEGFDWPWIGGQLAGSRLYATVLTCH